VCYLSRAAHEVDAAAEMAASHKEEKCVDLGASYIFEPIAVETLGVFNASARHLYDDLGRRISLNSGEAIERPTTCIRGSQYWCSASTLSYCTTVCLQPLTARIDDHTHALSSFPLNFKPHRDYTYRGFKIIAITRSARRAYLFPAPTIQLRIMVWIRIRNVYPDRLQHLITWSLAHPSPSKKFHQNPFRTF